MSLLTPDLGLLFWMLLSFLLVFGALAKFGFPIITGMVDKRRAHITESLLEADKARLRIESVEEDARKIMDEASKRSSEMLSSAVAESQRIVESARERAEADAAARMEAAKSQIAIEKEKALGEMRTTVALLSVEVAEKILHSKLEDGAENNSLVNRLIDEVEANGQTR
ncbi:MAG: F0F1 ATP synthase subunit B [Tidjanibacter sp.]|nr:F0F1 ATP synthase subunit B [Tidjanibacter sp.]